MNKFVVFITLIFALSFSFKVFGQNQVGVMKKHYEISSSIDNEDFTQYEQAINNYTELDQFRFLENRRTIKFSGSEVTIELYSAKELFEQYGKEIAPSTIMPGTFYKPVNFMITVNDEILTIFPLYIKQDPIQY